jgi:primosomal protein N' (replication factor Y)
VEEDLKALLPHARVIRMDLDTTSRRGAHDRLLTTFGRREVDVLLGTQMVAKGLDFPHVTLVGVISADTQLLLPDFRASERTFQLLTQVAGRAGRSELQGEVIIQSAQADHHTLQHVVHHDYRGFFHEEINHRRELDYPPFARLVLIEARGEVEEQVQSTAERLGQALSRTGGPFLLLGPAPAAIGKIKKNYRWHLLLKSRKSDDPSGRLTHVALRLALDSAAFRSPAVQVVVDVDPVSIM